MRVIVCLFRCCGFLAAHCFSGDRPQRFYRRQLVGYRSHIRPSKLYSLALRPLFSTIRAVLFVRIAHASRDAWNAILEPPQWDDIEKVERAWGLDTTNRDFFLSQQKTAIGINSLLMMTILLILIYLQPINVGWLILELVCGFLALLVVGLNISIALWRFRVIKTRHPQNYPDWLLQR